MSAHEEILAVQYLSAHPAAVPLPEFGAKCRLSCTGRPGALARFFRARPQLFTLTVSGNGSFSVGLVAGAEEVRLILFLSARPDQRSTFAAMGAQCPLASCSGRPGAYARFVRTRPHYFELVGANEVQLQAYSEAVAQPSAAESARAKLGLGGVAGCSLCAIPYFTSAQQRREHEGGAPHRRMRAAAALAAAEMGVGARADGAAALPPQSLSLLHGIELRVATATPGVSAQAVATLEAALGSKATLDLLLSNSGSLPWALAEALVHPAAPELTIVTPGEGTLLPPSTSATLSLRFAPLQAGSARILVSLTLLPQHPHASQAPLRVGCCLELQSTNPAEAAELAALQPTAPYSRAQRRRRFGGEPEESPPKAGGGAGGQQKQYYRPPQVPLKRAEGSTMPGTPAYARLVAELSAQCSSVAARCARLSLLLLCEEDAARKDMAAFDMEGVRLTPSGQLARLLVPGLAEARPCVKRDDTVVLRRAGLDAAAAAPTYRGIVAEVGLAEVALRLGPKARAQAAAGAWDVQFELGRGAYLVQHAALGAQAGSGRCSVDAAVAAMLEPWELGAGAEAEAGSVLRAQLPAPLHVSPPLNAPQQAAVAGALHRFPAAISSSSSSAQQQQQQQPPFIIFGPPGTGKTSTLTEYILQVLAAAAAPQQARVALRPSPAGLASLLTGLSSAMAGLSLEGASSSSSSSSSRAQALLPQPLLPPALVLVTAPSNSAVDGLAARLLHAGLPSEHLLRVNAFSRPQAAMPPAVQACAQALWSSEQGGYLLPEAAHLARVRVVAATCCTAQRLIRTLLLLQPQPRSAEGGGPFSHVVVDEAGQCTEPETLCAISGALRARGCGRVVLAGDPRQLGPVLRSDLAKAHGLGVSALERLMGSGAHAASEGSSSQDPLRPRGFHPAYAAMLTLNYRSHAALIAVPNALFYGGALAASSNAAAASALCGWPGLTAAARAVPGGFPLLFHGVRGRDLQEGSSPSFFNPEEALAAVQHVASVLQFARGRLQLAPSDCGIVTPYHKQAVKLRQLLAGRPELAGVAVGSVELFQGGERAVIVVSTVRASSALLAQDAKHALGFLDNPRRFNVAVTRARQLLVIVGDPAILAQDDSWSALLRYAVANGAYRGCALPPGFEAGAAEGSSSGGGLLQSLRAQAEAAVAEEAAELEEEGAEG